jgi:hypothetical protein
MRRREFEEFASILIDRVFTPALFLAHPNVDYIGEIPDAAYELISGLVAVESRLESLPYSVKKPVKQLHKFVLGNIYQGEPYPHLKHIEELTNQAWAALLDELDKARQTEHDETFNLRPPPQYRPPFCD